MELDDTEALREPLIHPAEDSGSAYETDSENVHNSSHDEQAEVSRSSRATSVKGRGRRNDTHEAIECGREESPLGAEAVRSAAVNEDFFEDAVEWAAKFQAPESADDIKNPRRRDPGSRKKRRAQKPANEIRAKRLKLYYNNDYRDLLNIDIEDTASRRLNEERLPLQSSQIGCSIWTAGEKSLFFTALTRLGRDDVRGIASRIVSKSELQVQEYIQLLNAGFKKEKTHKNRLLLPTDMPAAVQISDECSGVLERAGDALAIRQELAEEKIEKTKWRDSWLLTKEVSRWIEKRRKGDGGEDAVEEVLPAANLFNLKNWLELSDTVFMNPAVPHEEDNWQSLAEAGETPAIRATAFEDFHSLVVNITKRLVSSTLFCTMSRLRARGSNKIKYAAINSDDVEAAVNILGMKNNSSKFWIGCARRCHLQVVYDGPDLEEEEGEELYMTYDEIEAALTPRSPAGSRSTSRPVESRPSTRSSAHSNLPASSSSDLEFDISSSDSSVIDDSAASLENSDSDSTSLSLSSKPFARYSSRRLESKRKKKAARKFAECAQDTYIEAFDVQASQLEEARLWTLLEQDAPFEVGKVELLEKLEIGKWKYSGGEIGNWREWVGFWSPWETMETSVLEERFQRNRRMVSKKARSRVARNLREEGLESSEELSDSEDWDSQEESEESEREIKEPAGEGVDTGDGVQGNDEELDIDPDGSGHSSPAQQYEGEDDVSIKME